MESRATGRYIRNTHKVKHKSHRDCGTLQQGTVTMVAARGKEGEGTTSDLEGMLGGLEDAMIMGTGNTRVSMHGDVYVDKDTWLQPSRQG